MEPEANLTKQTVDKILEMVSQGSLKEGDFFATESELEKKFNISRPVIREAISRIRGLGILKSRKRKGLIIDKPDPIKLFEQAFKYGVMGAIDIRELAELRYTIEIGAIELAAMRATDEQLLSLSKLADEYTASVLPNYSGREQDQIELEFHQTILKASHNTMLIQMHHVLIAFFARAILEFPKWNMANKDKVSWEHQAIAKALAKRNTERARILLSGHLEQIILDKEKDI